MNEQGTLYGTTYEGGTVGNGTVFSLNPSTGVEVIIYSFQNNNTGELPSGGLIVVKGVLFGTTEYGGTYNVGTVISLDPKTGAEVVAHSFGGVDSKGNLDGFTPLAGLTNREGTLYGTTESGGNNDFGTVFSLDPANGNETVLHAFGNGTDGSLPFAELTKVKTTLYGTTYNGGTFEGGTVFSTDSLTGNETVLHSFDKKGATGYEPIAGLLQLNGKLYGTTGYGVSHSGGTVFSVKP